ncbi:universal stress protein [Brevibacterium daeguense]|uniref:Universal stress protein n=1 Tax=Brevibacterium daeguense TaxID=909936 RepID=A0ABP8ELL8_9MICO|nr:universal stress protein [Brevibacterium daeguense]
MTILVGYTPSPEGMAAVKFGIRQAKAFDDTLLVLNAGIGEAIDELGVASKDDLKEVAGALEAAGVKHELKQFLRGNDAVDEILALAEATPEVWMIVIGSRKRSPVGKLIMGSTAQRIILDAEVPVVSVKAENGTGR